MRTLITGLDGFTGRHLSDILAHLATEHMQTHLSEAQPWFDTLEMETYESTKVELI